MATTEDPGPTLLGAIERVVVFSLLVALMAGVAWAARSLEYPHLIGFTNDDASYALTGRALMEGRGYVDLGTPMAPPALRYPIGFPALLALIMTGAHDLGEQVTRLQWVPPAAAAAFVGLTFAYVRRLAAGSMWVALAIAALVGAHPLVLALGSLVMSDLPFGVAMLMAMITIEILLAGRLTPGKVMLIGMMAGLPCLIRYAGVALLLSVGIVVFSRGRARSTGIFAAGATVMLGPWFAYRFAHGGESYVAEFGHGVSPHVAQFTHQVPLIAGYLLTSALPGFVAPWAVQAMDVRTLLTGCLLSLSIGVGMVAWWRRPGESESGLAPLTLGFTIAMAVLWQFGFMYLGDSLISRLIVPLAPLVVYACLRGTRELAAAVGVPPAWVQAGLALTAAVTIAGDFALTGQHLAAFNRRIVPVLALNDYPQLFEQIRHRVPQNALIASVHAGMISFYTDRPCYSISNELTPPQLHQMIHGLHVQYVLGTPNTTVIPKGLLANESRNYQLGDDRSVALLNAYSREYPGELLPVWLNSSKRFAIFAVDAPTP